MPRCRALYVSFKRTEPAAMRPLVDFLVVRVTNIAGLPKIAHIANDQRSHACCMQRGYQVCRLLMQSAQIVPSFLPENPRRPHRATDRNVLPDFSLLKDTKD